MHVAAICFDIHISQSQSLKAKRAAIRPIIDGIQHRYRVSVAEVGYQDQWQRSEIGVAVVAGDVGHVQEVLDKVERFVVSMPDIELLKTEISWVELDNEE